MATKRLCSVISAGAVLLATAGEVAASPVAQVRVALQQNDVVPSDLAASAQVEVRRLFSLIGVDVVWVNELNDTRGVRVVKVTTWEPADSRIASSALGVTYTGEHGTRRAYVLWSRVQRVAMKAAVRLDVMLAVAIAHELGHLLLSNGSHGKHGVMRASWDANDLRHAAVGQLHFSRDSAVSIAQGLKQGTAIAGRR
jgi:hypothetical protein